jgi:EpsI family protein
MSICLRAALLVAMLIAARQYVVARKPVDVPLARPLATFPTAIDEWRGTDAGDLDPEIARVLGADDYLNRVYYANGSNDLVGLYVAYYGSQQQGDAIHSPLHCLPGNGWTPVLHTRHRVDVGSARIPVNDYIVEKGGIRNLVIYWFQGRGRVVASEYVNKAYLLADAFRLGRTDEALVRIVTPIGNRPAEDISTRFVRSIFPLLSRQLP